MKLIKFLRQREGRGLPLWRIGVVLPLTILGALATASITFYVGWELLAVTGVKAEGTIESKTLFELVKLAFGVVAGAGALVALVVAYRKQRVDEAGALREATRLHTERFTAAVGQLGDPSPAVRLGGVHALAGLADDAPTTPLRQTCIDVLCAYVRLPYLRVREGSTFDPARQEYLALREVRHTVLRVIADHLRRKTAKSNGLPSWRGHHFDFSGATFDGGSMVSSDFTGCSASFFECRFVGEGLDLSACVFGPGSSVTFSGSRIIRSALRLPMAEVSRGVRLSLAFVQIDEGLLELDQSSFDGLVDLSNMKIESGTLALSNIDVLPHARLTFYRSEYGAAAEVDCTRLKIEPAAPPVNLHIIDFRRMTGAAPTGLVPSQGEPVPSRLLLPPEWLSTGDNQS